jgi:hypothetical protein
LKINIARSAIFAFWLLMTAWLIRYEAFPEKFMESPGGYGTLLRHGPLILDSWMQIESSGLPVGYSHTWVDTSLEYGDAAYTVRNQTFLNFKIMGQDQTIGINADATLDEQYCLQKFSAAMFAGLYTTRIDGHRSGPGRFDVIIKTPAAERRMAMEIPEDVVLYSPMLELAMQRLDIGERLRIRTIDPLSLTLADVMVEAVRREKIPLADKPADATLLNVSYQGMNARVWIDDNGKVIREETPFGLTMRASTPREILGRKRKSYEGADLFAAASVPVRRVGSQAGACPLIDGRRAGKLSDPRASKRLRVRLNGPAQGLDGLASHRQQVKERLPDAVVMELVAQKQPENMAALGAPMPAEMTDFLASSASIQSDDEQIVNLAQEITGGKTNCFAAAKAINEWVYRNIVKQPTVSLPSALDVLQRREGDCNEHTYLFVALARAAGLPARINVGIVYAEVDDRPGAFYYHAWPSVYVGQWVEMDPTFGAPLVDAAYISLLSGEMADQLKLLGVFGRISVDILEEGSQKSEVSGQ